MSMPFYVAPEQMMKDRADYARKGIARGRALVAMRYTDGIVIVAENASETLRKVSEIYDRIAFAGVGKYNEFDQLRVAGDPRRRPQGVPVLPRRRRRPQPGEQLRADARQHLHPRDEADGGRDPRRRGRTRRTPATRCSTSSTTAPSSTSGTTPRSVATPSRSERTWPSTGPTTSTCRLPSASGVAALAGGDREIPAGDLEVAALSRGNGRRCFHRIAEADVESLLSDA